LTLTKESLDATLKPYPLIEKSIALIAEERYSTHLKKKESMLSDKFGEELTACITQNELQNVFIFKDADSEFLHRLAITLVPVQFFQNQIIMKKGDIANAMYFLVKGTVQAVDEYSTKVFATFEPGSFFGEIGLLMKNTTRTATIKCASPDVLVFSCEKKNLDRIIEDYPDMKKKIEAEMYRRYEYVRHRDNEESDTGATDFESIREKLKKVALFKNASSAFVHEIALKVVLKRGQPGDVIVRHGDSANSMFFIVDGTVQIASADRSKEFAEMSTDSYFGEVSLFFDQRRTATVICKSETTLVELGKDAVDATFLMYPELKETIASVAAENYKAYCKRERISADSVVSGMISLEATAEHLKAVL
jgi:CRP-like cAMP-binding protein